MVESKTLTHLVMPFVDTQILIVRQSLQTWTSQYYPCNSSNYEAQVQLILYASFQNLANPNVESASIITSLLSKTLNSSQFKYCFKSWTIAFAKISTLDNSHHTGSRLMFEKMLSKNISHSAPMDYVLYMEPDCVPIRHNWLEAVQRNVKEDPNSFWMKGSVFRGQRAIVNKQPLHLINYFHLNGNAIYSVGDNEFRNFYFQKVRPFTIEKCKSPKDKYCSVFDTDIFRYLLHNNMEYGAQYIHHFAFTDLIQNKWHTNYSTHGLLAKSPNTFLVHGGAALD